MKRTVAVMAFLSALAGPFAFAAGGTTLLQRYRIQLDVAPEEAENVTRQLLAICRCRIEPYAEESFIGFVVLASPSSADVLSRAPHVVAVAPLGGEAVVPAPAVAPAAVVEAGHGEPRMLPTATTAWGTGAYAYDAAGNIKSIGSDVYVYDALSRVRHGDAGTGRSQDYTYDRFGNLLTITTAGAPAAINLGVTPATNQLTDTTKNASGTYDLAGQLRTFLGNSFDYDGLGMVSAATVDSVRKVYLYSADDERIATITVNGVGTETSSEWTIRDTAGQVVRRFDRTSTATWKWREDYIYRDGAMLAAEVDTPERTLHFHPDHLGTPRLITGSGGAMVSLHTYYPFGFEATSSSQDLEKKKFTGHERDSQTLDYMHARYYTPVWGRFLSVDPGGYDPARPQSWNRYSYVTNNPLGRIDPDGRCEQAPNAPPCSDMETTVTAEGAGLLEHVNFISTETTAELTPFGFVPGTPEGLWESYKAKQYAKAHPDEKPKIMIGVIFLGSLGRTEPTLPAKTLAAEGEVTIKHNYRSGDHPPAHAHVEGGGPSTRIGPNGKPILNDPAMTAAQRAVYDANKSVVRRAINKIGRWLDYMGL